MSALLSTIYLIDNSAFSCQPFLKMTGIGNVTSVRAQDFKSVTTNIIGA